MNLIEGALGYLGAGVVEKASTLVGESPAGTRRALETAVPALVAGLAGEASQMGGAGKILRVVEDAGFAGPHASVAERLRGASGEELVGLGKDLIGRVFGGRMSGVCDAAAGAAGVRPASMTALAGLAAPLVFGVLGSTIHARHLDAAGLAGMLGAQRSTAVSALPAAVAAALPDGQSARPAAPREGRRAPPPQRFGRFWPLILLIPVAILAGLFFRKPSTSTTEGWVPRPRLGAGLPPATPERAPGIEAPGPGVVSEGLIGSEMAQFLATPSGEPSRRFAFDDLAFFEVGTANLMPQALTTLDGVAEVLKAYPSTVILVEGHTDSTGVPADNQGLSLQRAGAVKNALVARGVPADRITTAGLGQDRPVASNDTPEGRARNRRTELVVTR